MAEHHKCHIKGAEYFFTGITSLSQMKSGSIYHDFLKSALWIPSIHVVNADRYEPYQMLFGAKGKKGESHFSKPLCLQPQPPASDLNDGSLQVFPSPNYGTG